MNIQAKALDNLNVTLSSVIEPLDARELFSKDQPLEVELGCGDASFLVEYARRNPQTNFIGVERLLGRLQKLDRKGRRLGLTNLRGVRIESSYFLQYLLPPHSAEALHVYFPDPWPKLRHHKRRIVAPGPVAALGRVLRDGAELRIATDDPDYKGWILAQVLADGAFEWCARQPSDWRIRPADWPETRYEAKARAAGRTPSFFRFRRRPRAG